MELNIDCDGGPLTRQDKTQRKQSTTGGVKNNFIRDLAGALLPIGCEFSVLGITMEKMNLKLMPRLLSSDSCLFSRQGKLIRKTARDNVFKFVACYW